MPGPDDVQITLKVPFRMHRGLTELARKAGQRNATAYAGQLLNAAYTARVRPPTGDAELDAAVGMVAVLWAEGRDFDAIAATLSLSEATVAKIVAGWQQHHLARAEGAAP